jgi:hypothetical protein
VSESARENAELELEELAAVSPERMGWFRFYFDDHRWEWSEQVQRLHGYQPGTVTPTTDLVLSHKHPDDRDQVAAIIDDITHTRGALSSRHRIIDTGGMVHWVVVIGDQFFGDDGAVIGTHGFYVDVTPAEGVRQDMVTARLREIVDSRALIEQAKGMLMFIYDVDDELHSVYSNGCPRKTTSNCVYWPNRFALICGPWQGTQFPARPLSTTC